MESGPRLPKKEIVPGLEDWQREGILLLREPLARIYKQYQSEIEQGKYGLVLGDDVSGRIPALIFAEVISDTYARRNHVAPLVRFVSGGRHTTHSHIVELPEQLERRMQATENLLRSFAKEVERSGGNPDVLFVTEAIIHGDAMSTFLNSTKRAGLNIDIAAIGVRDHGVARVREQHGTRIEAGQQGLPAIYGDRTLTGLQKERGSPVARALHQIHPYTNVNAPIREARELVHEVALGVLEDVASPKE